MQRDCAGAVHVYQFRDQLPDADQEEDGSESVDAMKYTVAIRGKYQKWIVPVSEDTAKGMLVDSVDVQEVVAVVRLDTPWLWDRLIRWLGGE